MPPKTKKTTSTAKTGNAQAKGKTGKQKAKSPPNAVPATPSKKGKPNPKEEVKNVANPYAKKQCVVVTLITGEHRGFDTVADANEFSGEHQDVIASTQYFDTKAKMQSFLSASPAKAEPDVEVVNPSTMSPEDKSKFNTIRAAIEQTKPRPRICVDWKTTKKANVVIMIMVARAENGEMIWHFKKPLDQVLIQYFKNCPSENNFTNDFMTNLQTAKMRDPDKGSNDVLVTKRKKDDREFPVYAFYTWANLPVEDFKLDGAAKERDYIENEINKAICHFRAAQRTPLFMNVMKETFSERMFEAMNKESQYGPTFTQFVQKCKITHDRIDNLNKYVILDESKNMQLFLLKNELPHKKYPNDDVLEPTTTAVPIKSEPQDSNPTTTGQSKNLKKKNSKKVTPEKTAAAVEAEPIDANDSGCEVQADVVASDDETDSDEE